MKNKLMTWLLICTTFIWLRWIKNMGVEQGGSSAC